MSSYTGLHFETFPVGQLQCNCSIIADIESKDALIVDPGDDGDMICEKIESEGFKVNALIHTHAHFDHIGACSHVKKKTGAPIRLHEEDKLLYENLPMQGQMFGMVFDPADPPDNWIVDNEEIEFGKFKITTLHTPGHTPGSISFLLEDPESKGAPVLFSGDTLFRNSIGRTDLWGGDFDLIKKSIKDRLYTLPEETIVITGHGPQTSIYDEKSSNPFVPA